MNVDDLSTPDDFIEFYTPIPDEKWCTNAYDDEDQRCALGHLGARLDDDFKDDVPTKASKVLCALFSRYGNKIGQTFLVSDVNDGVVKRFDQPTPKARILAALDEIKKSDAFSN